MHGKRMNAHHFQKALQSFKKYAAWQHRYEICAIKDMNPEKTDMPKDVFQGQPQDFAYNYKTKYSSMGETQSIIIGVILADCVFCISQYIFQIFEIEGSHKTFFLQAFLQ